MDWFLHSEAVLLSEHGIGGGVGSCTNCDVLLVTKARREPQSRSSRSHPRLGLSLSLGRTSKASTAGSPLSGIEPQSSDDGCMEHRTLACADSHDGEGQGHVGVLGLSYSCRRPARSVSIPTVLRSPGQLCPEGHTFH